MTCTCEKSIAPGGTDSACACVAACVAGSDLIYDPFLSLKAAFGMLLGEDDFVALAANPRGKLMLHNAWLHGTGVAWGFPVCSAKATLLVGPGLAIDGIGRELHLDSPNCIDLDCWAKEWAESHEDLFEGDGHGCETAAATVCVVASFDTCDTRPVSSITDVCDPSRRGVGYSRVYETVKLELRDHHDRSCDSRDCDSCDCKSGTGDSCCCKPCCCERCCCEPSGFHRVRVLLGLDCLIGPDDDAGRHALGLRNAIALLPEHERAEALLEAFRRLAAADVTSLVPCRTDSDPCRSWFPVSQDCPHVVLASVVLRIARVNDCVTATVVAIDESVRCALIPTQTIQELTCGLAPGLLGERSAPDAGGPRVIPESFSWLDGTRTCFSFSVTRTLLEGSLLPKSFKVTTVSEYGGWNDVDIKQVHYSDDTRTVTIWLFDRPTYGYVRLVVPGTGPLPVLGDDFVPLAGLVGGPPGTRSRGVDAELVLSWPTGAR